MDRDPGLHRALTHLRRHGDLSYRLARAVLGSPEAATDVVVRVFAGFAHKKQLPSWFATLHAVRKACESMPSAENRESRVPSPSLPSEDSGETEALHVTLPADDVAAAFFSLEASDRQVLWQALLNHTSREPLAYDVDALAEALLRLEIAIGNLGIPGEGEPEWPE